MKNINRRNQDEGPETRLIDSVNDRDGRIRLTLSTFSKTPNCFERSVVEFFEVACLISDNWANFEEKFIFQ